MFGAEQSKRRRAERVHTECLWPTDYLSACLSLLIHSSLATRPRPHAALPLPLHVRVTNGCLSLEETSIIIRTQSRCKTSGNMHLSSQSMLDGCRERSLKTLMWRFVVWLFRFWNAATINYWRAFGRCSLQDTSMAASINTHDRGYMQFDIVGCCRHVSLALSRGILWLDQSVQWASSIRLRALKVGCW